MPWREHSQIIGGIQAPQTTLVWTDTDLWSMQYVGPPLVYGFSIIGHGCGMIAANARAVLGRSVYWMGQKGFWAFGDSGVQYLECPIWDTIFNNLLAFDQQPVHPKIFAGANESFNEVWFFYPSLASSNGECDSYVKFNPLTGTWDYGSLNRTAWLGVNVLGMPLSADPSLHVMQHETGFDDDTNAMQGVYAETGFFDIGDGEYMPFVREIIPDIKWFGGSGASLTFTIWGQNDS